MLRIDVAHGTFTVQAISPGVVPDDELHYNYNDGMLYGVNIYQVYAYYPNNLPPTLIRINPSNGIVTSLKVVPEWGLTGGPYTAFDNCSNTFIMFGNAYTYWLSPSSGNVVKQSSKLTNGWDLAPISNLIP